LFEGTLTPVLFIGYIHVFYMNRGVSKRILTYIEGHNCQIK